MQAAASAAGVWVLSYSTLANDLRGRGPISEAARGVDSDLGPEGALYTGMVGLVHANTAASGRALLGTEFHFWEPAENVVCHAGKSIEFNSQGVLRESEDGKTWGPPDLPRGGNFYLEPAGADGRINRIVIVARRNDVEVEPDNHVEDRHTVEIKVRERYLLPR